MAEVKVRATIAGTVWQIPARIGDRLEEDDPMVIMESMKMEIPVGAPRSGTVKSILVAEGEIVAENDVIALLESN
ncbi:MAG: biotin/lipoyl-binding carrier protein [Xanthobacteraceae bacterium]